MSNLHELTERAESEFRNRFHRRPEIAVAAPGRANLIGEHTDYNDGHVLPIAIDRFTVAAAANRTDRRFRLYTHNLKESFEFDLDAVPGERPVWASYLVGVAAEMEGEGYRISGKDMILTGDVPLGSGLSSSASLEISAATAIERLEDLDIDDGRLVSACCRGDHRYVGIECGPMDQFASRSCRANHAGLLDCRSLEMTQKRLPADILYLSVYSGIPRSLTNSAYNERLASCRKAVGILRQTGAGIRALRDADPGMVDAARDRLDETTFRRARHVVTEQRRLFQLVTALDGDDRTAVGRILREGHRSLSRDYEVSLPVLDSMVDWFYGREGVIGARLTGAGFGGSLICLLEPDAGPEAIQEEFIHTFQGRTPDPPQIWQLASVDGARHRPNLLG